MDVAYIRAARDRALAAIEVRNSLSTWSVSRIGSGAGTVDPVTGDWVPPTETTFEVNGHFRVSSRPKIRSRMDAQLTVEEPTLCVAASDTPLEINDIVELEDGCDESLFGRAWRVVGRPASSFAIHREYPLEEVTAS